MRSIELRSRRHKHLSSRGCSGVQDAPVSRQSRCALICHATNALEKLAAVGRCPKLGAVPPDHITTLRQTAGNGVGWKLVSSSIQAIDNFLPREEHEAVWTSLRQGDWRYGAFSEQGGDRYFYRHFAGFREAGNEYPDARAIEGELDRWPLIAAVWARLKAGPLANQALARCYANGMPPGIGGGVHLDSNVPSHLTAIYYPHQSWRPDLAGETLFFNAAMDEVVAAVYPRPNRLVLFPGTIPHVARPISSRAGEMRITLMFKTLGPIEPR
jgi:SM-20-related protein